MVDAVAMFFLVDDIPDSDERITCRLLTVSGKGKHKTIRFYKGGLVVLK